MTEERLWVFLDVFDDMKKVNIISLGCSKNLVDTEMLLKQLDQAGYDTETDVENSDAEVVIVNTCGFIGDAKEESVNTILEQVERKKEGIVEQVYVIGCLSQRYGAELQEEIPSYKTAKEFKDDLLIIKQSLLDNGDDALLTGDFSELLQAVDVFGFYLATIDMRQDSSVNEACVAELLKSANIVEDYSALSEEEKVKVLLKELQEDPRTLSSTNAEKSANNTSFHILKVFLICLS